jgi:hypothetical protein
VGYAPIAKHGIGILQNLVIINPQFYQILMPGADFIPLLPIAHPNSSSYPLVQFFSHLFHIGNVEMVYPAIN